MQALLGRQKSTNVSTQKVPVKKHDICSDPISADPFVSFRDPWVAHLARSEVLVAALADEVVRELLVLHEDGAAEQRLRELQILLHHLYIYICICIIYIYIYVCVYLSLYIYTHIHIGVCMCVYIYIHIYTCVYDIYIYI